MTFEGAPHLGRVKTQKSVLIRRLTLLGLVLSSFVASSAWAEEEKFVYCRLGKIVRTIRTVKTDNGGCQTIYSKAGIDRVVGAGQHWGSCYDFIKNIRDNLEKASWKCREIDNFKVMFSQVERSVSEKPTREPAKESESTDFKEMKKE